MRQRTLVIVVVAEMFIGSTDGLGQRVSRRNSFAAGALGYGLNLLTIEQG
ncbi:hypothetical protein [Bradyrhizobium sp.]